MSFGYRRLRQRERERVALFREHQRTTQNLGTDFRDIQIESKEKKETRILRNGSFVSRQCYTVSVASYSFLDRRFGRFSRRNQIMIDHRILKVSSHNDFPFVFVLASRTTRFSLDSISFAPRERDFIVRDDGRTCDVSNFAKRF